MALLRTRALNPETDWNFFHERHPIEPSDLELIRPLDDEYAASLWCELVSPHLRERHPMLLPREHWLGNLTAAGPDWQEFWYRPGLPDAVVRFLQSQINWPETAEVFFVWMREQAVRVPWGVFLRTWRSFLFSSEGPFVVRLQSPEFAFFAPTAMMGVGSRAEPHRASKT